MHRGLQVIAAKPWVVAVDKPAGLPAVPGRTEAHADCVWTRLLSVQPDALVVHRLDMATSGVMVFAIGAAAQRAISMAFERRQINKRYVADVHGLVAEDEGQMTWPLIADWPNRPRQRVDLVHGKPSTTLFRVLSRDATRNTSRLALTPITGRSHQLRVHCLTLGHPIVGDKLYGPSDGAATLRLHATRIDLPTPPPHDSDASRVQFESKEPAWT